MQTRYVAGFYLFTGRLTLLFRKYIAENKSQTSGYKAEG